jgi:hypothetical protein
MSKTEGAQKKAYLVSHVYPGGQHVVVLFATDADDVEKRYPPLRVIPEPPPWLDQEMMARMTCKAHDVDKPETWLPAFINPPHSEGGRIRIS